uniref:Glycosyltransferase n=1 Tax=Setaria italica TaxID=4555 RepID=K3YM82_SETIT
MASSIRAGRRVVCFPFPYQGHFNPMLRLAGALHAGGVAITVFHTDLRAPDPDDYPSDYRFVPVPVHVPTELMGSEDIARLVTELNVSCAAPFKERLAALLAEEEEEEEEPGGVRCVVTDVIWYSAQAVARELGVPALGLMSSSAASFRNFMVYPALIEKGYLPVQEDHTDGPVDVLPPFRVRDLQRIETSSLNDFASLLGLIINTIEAIETVELDKIHEDMSIPVFVIGPLNKFSPPQDRRCLDWLDTQTPGSVIYVSFGSLAAMDPHEFVELAWGWADTFQPAYKLKRTSPGDRGRIIDWAPQDEVLAHPTVCAFLTHNGWNSTMEAISEGVPMISRPLLGDQYGNAMFVCEVRRVGVEVEVENQLERLRIRDAIEKLMSSKEGKEVRERMTSLKETAENGIKESGSSHTAFLNLADLIFSL